MRLYGSATILHKTLPRVYMYLCKYTHGVSLQESGVGKTCVVNRFVSDVFTDHENLTVG